MRSIERNKIAAIGLLVVLVIGFGQATKPAWPLEAETEHEIYVDRHYPKVGEVFEVIYRVRLKANIQPEFGKRNFFVKFGTGTYGPAEVIGTDEICIPFLVPGEWQEVRGKYRIQKPYKMVYINAWLGTAKDHKYRIVGGCLKLFLIDSLTCQYGTEEEWLKRAINVFWKYNNLEPQWLSEPDQAWETSNRKIAQEMRKFEPALTDSEALCLHQDNYLLIINAIGDSNATDDERIEYLLKAGWLEAQRSGAEVKEKWFNDFMEKNKRRWGGNFNLNFFRDNNSSNSDYLGSNNPPKDRITTTSIGPPFLFLKA